MADLVRNQFDGNVSFIGGMDEGLHPSIIQDNQSRKNINTTVKRGSISSRPFYCELSDFKILGGESKLAQGFKSYEEIFHRGRLQHAGEYQTSTNNYLVLVISGIIYLVDIERCEVVVVEIGGTVAPKLLNYECTRINGVQADDYYVIFDWPNNPVYISSTLEAKRSDADFIQIPRSYIGAFVHNRLFVGNAGNSFGASDPVGPTNVTNSDPLALAPISFTESIVADNNPSPPYADQFFTTSYTERTSNITAMGYFYGITQPTGTGYGPLFVATDRSIQVFPINRTRDQWASGFGQVMVFDKGIVGQKAFTNVGDDLFYQSTDCQIYSLKQVLSDQQRWGYTDISREVSPTIQTRNKHLIKYSDLEYYSNRLYATVSPYITRAIDPYGRCVEDYSFRSLATLEFQSASGLSRRGNPVWSSYYPGSFNCLVQVGDKLVSIGKNKTDNRNSIKIIEDNRQCGGDKLCGGTHIPVRSRVYTRQYDFNLPLVDKYMKGVVADFRNLTSSFKATVSYRTSPTCEWAELGELVHKCEEECGILKAVDTKNEALCAISDGKEDTCFKCIEFKIDIASWSRGWELIKFYVIADRSGEPSHDREMDAPLDECSLLCRDIEVGDMDLWE